MIKSIFREKNLSLKSTYIYNSKPSTTYQLLNYTLNLQGYPLLKQTELGAIQQPILVRTTTYSVSQ